MFKTNLCVSTCISNISKWNSIIQEQTNVKDKYYGIRHFDLKCEMKFISACEQKIEMQTRYLVFVLTLIPLNKIVFI